PINTAVTWLVREYQDRFDQIASPVRAVIVALESTLRRAPAWLVLTIVVALVYAISRGLWQTLTVALCLLLIMGLGLWTLAMQTLALMLISTFISVLIGMPLGVLLAYNTRLRSLTLPLLDAMQTMPSFVYLIPALMLFGLGKVPAVFA